VETVAAVPEEETVPCVVPTLTIEIYETRLRERESEQQQALAKAIAEQDNITRDHVQIELVAVTDRIALLEDSYKEEMQWRQAALEALQAIAPDADEDTIKSLQEELSSGETVQAEKLFKEVADQKGDNAALAAFHAGRLAEARVDLYQALERYQQAVELDSDSSEHLKAAGVMARKLYRYRDARPLLEKLVDLLASQDSDSIELALARRELGYTYALSGALKQAGPLYKQSMKTIAEQLGQEHLEMGISWNQIAELQEAKGQYDQAAPTYSKALAILEKELGQEHPGLDHILEKLAGLNAELEEDEKAATLYGRLCAIREKSLGATHPKLAMALQNLAEAYRLQGQYEAAEESYNKALAIMEANHGKDHPAVAAVLQELAKLCFRQKKNDEGEALQKRATEIFEQSIQGQEDDITEDALNLQEKE
jgi:tetratricopeptide (TPR) repeat protein